METTITYYYIGVFVYYYYYYSFFRNLYYITITLFLIIFTILLLPQLYYLHKREEQSMGCHQQKLHSSSIIKQHLHDTVSPILQQIHIYVERAIWPYHIMSVHMRPFPTLFENRHVIKATARGRGLRTTAKVFSPCNYYAGVATTSNAVSFRSL